MSPEKMAEADNKLAAKLDELDKPEEKTDEVVETDKAPEGEESDAASDSGSSGDETGEAAEGESDADKSGDSDDEGYTIDEGDDEQPKLEGVTEEQVANLNPEQKYILDNLKPITVSGRVGDGEVQRFEVYDPQQLPAGFKYLDEREMSIANKAFNMLEAQADRLQNDYRSQANSKVAKDFAQREQTADRADLSQLQKDGDFPLFKKNPAVPRGVDQSNYRNLVKVLADDGDEAGKLALEVLDFKDKTNQRYVDEYNSGRPYKHIGFEEAYRIFKRDNPSRVDTDQAKEDAERKKIAQRTSRSRGSENSNVPEKARVHSGSSSRDLDNLIDNLDW